VNIFEPGTQTTPWLFPGIADLTYRTLQFLLGIWAWHTIVPSKCACALELLNMPVTAYAAAVYAGCVGSVNDD